MGGNTIVDIDKAFKKNKSNNIKYSKGPDLNMKKQKSCPVEMIGKKRNLRKFSNIEGNKENVENFFQPAKYDEAYLKDNSLETLLNEALKDRTSIHLNKKVSDSYLKVSKGKTKIEEDFNSEN